MAGYHEHFITEDRRGGGHILDYAMGHGQLQLSVVQHLNIELPRNPAFQQADLNPADLDRVIRAAEG